MCKLYRYNLLVISLFLLLSGAVGGQTSANANLPPAIVSFTIDQDSVMLSDVETGILWTNLHWRTVNMTDQHTLQLDAYQLNEWISILDINEVLQKQDSREINVMHPHNFGKPTYRLRILGENEKVVDEHILTINYTDLDNNTFPQISEFQLLDETYTVTEVDYNKQGLVWVTWSVTNRTPNSQLVFEQVTPTGTYKLAELPRDVLWIASVGQGPLIFTLDESVHEIQLRLQLQDVLTDVVLDESFITIPVNMSVTVADIPATPPSSETESPPVVSTTVNPAPNSDPPVTNQPEIIIFDVSPTYVKPGESYTLTWEVTPVEEDVWIQNDHPMWTGHILEDSRGSITYTTEANPINATDRTTNFTMVGPVRSESIRVEFECSYESVVTLSPSAYSWINTSCPGMVQSLPAAFESFENGFMIWLETNKKIYIFLNNSIGMHSIYDDTWSGEDIAWEETPPSGHYLPQRGFGWLWMNNETVRANLGWATAPEQGYSTKFQNVHITEGGPYNIISLSGGSFILMRVNVGVISWETLQ